MDNKLATIFRVSAEVSELRSIIVTITDKSVLKQHKFGFWRDAAFLIKIVMASGDPTGGCRNNTNLLLIKRLVTWEYSNIAAKKVAIGVKH